MHKLQNQPQCFHLEWPPPDEVVYWIVDCAAGCPKVTRLTGTRPSAANNIRLTECRCDLSGGNKSGDRWHLAYQEAYLKYALANISLFVELSQGGGNHKRELRKVFVNLTRSSLLVHCRLDTELLSLCRTFFGLAKGCLGMQIHSDDVEEGRNNMLEWFEVSIFLGSSSYCCYIVPELTIPLPYRRSRTVLPHKAKS